MCQPSSDEPWPGRNGCTYATRHAMESGVTRSLSLSSAAECFRLIFTIMTPPLSLQPREAMNEITLTKCTRQVDEMTFEMFKEFFFLSHFV